MTALRVVRIAVVLTLVAAGCVALALIVGSERLPLSEVIAALGGRGTPLATDIVVNLRLPRALSAFATGGLLAVAGALMQVLLRNPLADPYILGVSGGAAVAALAAMSVGLAGAWVDTGAFAGALGAMLLVFALAHGPGGWTPLRLLLTGVVVAAGLSAGISLLLALGPDSSLRGMLFWLMGDLSHADAWGRGLAVLVAAVAAGLLVARHLNVLSLGDDQARSLGVPVGPLRALIYVVASLLTAVAVTLAGSIGFIGLVVPHALRLAVGHDHRLILPGAALAGGSLLVVADTIARSVLAPRQLPVGALTALIGVPLFLALMRRQRRIG